MRRNLSWKRWCGLAVAAAMSGWGSIASADVKLPAVLSDAMVLQQQQPVPIWGWADEGEKVSVTFGGQTQETTAKDGKWKVMLTPLTASDKGAELTVTGKNKVTLKNILVGEVWLCSGQSNMEFVVRNAKDAAKDIAAANYPGIRLFTVGRSIKNEPADDTKASWQVCSPETVPGFSAVGYFFGRELHEKLKVPVGLIHASWGGTPAESWTAEKYLSDDPDLAGMLSGYKTKIAGYPAAKAKYEEAAAKWKAEADAAKKAGTKPPEKPRPPAAPGNDPWQPTSLYNGMIAPVIPFAIKGSIWYQGESNAGRAYQYRKLLPAMIKSWRDAWAEGGVKGPMKFLIVQLANFQDPAKTPGDDAWAELREAQTLTAAKPDNGMALAIDLADADNPKDIHPKNKQDVGKRLALVALGKFYGQDVVYQGPTYDSMKVDGDKITLTFKHAEGLKAEGHDGKVTGFAVAGQDKKWAWADGKIEGSTVVLTSPVKDPVAVRYAWSTNPVTNLYNGAGLPAQPFRTDTWDGITMKNK